MRKGLFFWMVQILWDEMRKYLTMSYRLKNQLSTYWSEDIIVKDNLLPNEPRIYIIS